MTELTYEFDDLEIAPGVTACGIAYLECTRQASIKGDDGEYKLTDLRLGWHSEKMTPIDDKNPLWPLVEIALNQHKNRHITNKYEDLVSEHSEPFIRYVQRHFEPRSL